MTRFSFSSLRVRLLLLVLLAVLPGVGLTLHATGRERQREIAAVQDNALVVARLISHEHEELVKGGRQLLFSLAHVRDDYPGDRESCRGLLAGLVRLHPIYANLKTARPDGHVSCSAVPADKQSNEADRPYFRRALETHAFTVGGYQINRITRKATFNLAYPILDRSGAVQSVLIAAVDLDRLSQPELQAGMDLPPGSTYTLIDCNGLVLARHPNPENWIGKQAPELPLLRGGLTRGRGAVRAPGPDGEASLYAAAQVPGEPNGTAATVILNIPEETAFAEINRDLVQNLVDLGVVGALTLGAAWIGVSLLVLRPVGVLAEKTGRLAAGDLSVRVGPSAGSGELGRLGRAFDGMAETLQAREIERMRTEEQLRVQSTALEAAANAIVITDREGGIVWVNPAFTRLTGYTSEEVSGQNPRLLKSGKHDAALYRDLWETILAGKVWHSELINRRKDGCLYTEEMTITPVVDAQGAIRHFIAIKHDITPRKRAEEALRDSEELLASLYRTVPVGICLTNEAGCYVQVNDAYCGMYGYAQEELLGQHFSLILLPEEVEPARAAHAKLLRGDMGGPSEGERRRKDGAKLWIEAAHALLIRGNGERLVITVANDITRRKQAESALRESEVHYRTLADRGQALIWTSGPDKKCDYFNEPWLRFTGRTLEQELGDGWAEGVHPEDLDRVVQTHVTAFDRRERFSLEYRLRHPSGEYRWIVDDGTPRYDGQGNFVGYIGHCLDITARKQAEAEREKLQAQLLQAQKMEAVGRLAGGIAHDFNNLLMGILNYAELCEDHLPPGTPVRAYLAEIRADAERSADLTRQLLAFARKQTVAPRVLDLNNTVAGMLKMLRRLIGEDISFPWLPGAQLWPVKIDPSQVDQILANLVVNARDAIAGAGTITIETEKVSLDASYCARHAGFTPGSYVLLAVSDTGCGMDAATQARLFEPYFTTKAVGQGTGLGLATVYGIVKQNGGFINVYSEPGKGTTIKVFLPRAAGEARVGGDAPKADTPRGRGEIVLVVEDEKAIRTTCGLLLQDLGYTLLTAATPAEALAVIAQHPGAIHLLLTDVVLPEMNGRELADRIAAVKPGLKALFMSGYTADVIGHRGVLDAGVHFLQKPFTRHDLAVRVREALT